MRPIAVVLALTLAACGKNATLDPNYRSLEGKWVRLTTDVHGFTLEEITAEEAETWWQENRPDPLDIGDMDRSVQTLVDAADILDLNGHTLSEALLDRIPALGGTAAHFGALSLIGPAVPTHGGFAIPVHFYGSWRSTGSGTTSTPW